jgi:hypothetical protein
MFEELWNKAQPDPLTETVLHIKPSFALLTPQAEPEPGAWILAPL